MAHIAIDARIINSSTGRYVERLLHYLQTIDADNHYSVLVQKKDRDYWHPTNPNFTVRVADFDNYSLDEQTKFKHLLDNLQPDLVHFCMPQQPVTYRGKTVTTFHDLTLIKTYNSDKNWLVFHLKQLVGKYVFRRVAKQSDHIIAISQHTKNELQAFAPVSDDKISVIYEAGETTSGTERLLALPFQKFLLYVGQQSDYKNIRRLGDAHQQLLKAHPDLGLVLAGKKTAASKKNEQYFESKHYKNIHFTDFIPDDQLNWLYAHAEAYIFPSLMEGFGLPGLEAMAHNLPVISSNTTCLPEIYGEAAAYFDPLNVADMATTIDAVISHDATKKRLVAAGQSQIKKYSWEKMAQETLTVYESVLKNSPVQS